MYLEVFGISILVDSRTWPTVLVVGAGSLNPDRGLEIIDNQYISPSLATQLWSDGCVAWGVYIFQDIAKVWS